MSIQTTVKRIALLGPESSGKTTLCRQLAEHYHTAWVSEYARGFISQLNRPYTLDDILHCAQSQLQLEEEEVSQAKQFLFCDTELIVSKIWSLDVFKQCPSWIADQIKQHRYDLYLLTAPDIPFESDPVRENPHRREELFSLYRQELDNYKFPYEIISGIGKKRFQNALKVIDKLV